MTSQISVEGADHSTSSFHGRDDVGAESPGEAWKCCPGRERFQARHPEREREMGEKEWERELGGS